MSTSQTLSRGLTALEFIALAEQPPSIDAVATHLGVHRSIAYRMVRTLEDHHLIERDPAGCCTPGVRLAALGRSARPTLQSVATPALAGLADEMMLTCFLVIADGNEALTLESLEPTTSQSHLTYRPGIRHPLDRGAPGLAILAGRPQSDGERSEVTESRRRGWAHTTGEVVDGLAAIAVPIPAADAAIATVFLAGAASDLDDIAHHLTLTAAAIADGLRLAEPRTRTAS